MATTFVFLSKHILFASYGIETVVNILMFISIVSVSL